MKHIICTLFLLLLLVANTANAQFYQTGQDPSSIQWRQINTENFQVIYPDEFENEAQRLTIVLSKVYDYGSETMNFNPRKISVVLHTRTAQSNGMVAWAPKRIELFTTPHQQMYAQDWLEQLAIHEFRHVVQMDKIQKELPFILKLIFGEQATAIVTGAYLPLWFLEGDAVVSETALSKTGRGRMASFSMEYRAQLAEKGKYSFDKAFLGSFKDFVPDHYKLGYWMVGKTREKYGPQIWSDVLNKVGNHPFNIVPMTSVLKKQTGMNSKKLYNKIFDDLAREWKPDMNSWTNSNVSTVSPSRKNFTNYRFAEFYKDSLIVAYRTAMDDIGRFVLIGPDQSEKIIYTPGSVFDESVSIKNHLIIWAERRADIRWTHADRSVILIYNIETNQKQEIRNENKLFSPVISPDLKSFAAVEVDPQNNVFLSIFDLNSGKAIQRFKANDHQYLFTPCWDEKGERLYVVSLSSKGKCMMSIDFQTKEFIPITPMTFGNLKNPVFTNDQLIFSADFSGTDHLYSLDPENLQISRIHKATFGADYPSGINSKNQMLFSNYSADGYRLAKINSSDQTNWKRVGDISLESNQLADNLTAQEKGMPDFESSDSIKYASKKYSKSGNLFSFHSWAPAYMDIDSYEIRPGISLFSQNKLGTAETRLGYDYNSADQTGKAHLGFNYLGWFPEIKTEFSAGEEASNYYPSDDSTFYRVTSQVQTADVGIDLPLDLSKGKYSRFLFPEITYSFENVKALDLTFSDQYHGSYHGLTYRVYFYNLLHTSAKSLMPKWGQQIDFTFKHTPFIGNDLGTLSGVQSVLFFPGLTKNAGFRIYQGYQERTFTQGYSFSDMVRYPRGFQSFQNNKMYSLAADYKFPIFYPDLSLGKFAYFKRLKTSLFYDFAWLSVPAKDRNGKIYPNYHEFNMKSLGVELTTDFHFLRFFAPLEMGVRSIYLPDSDTYRFDMLFSINVNGF